MQFSHLGMLVLLPGAVAAQGTTMSMDHEQMAMPGMLTQHAKDQVAAGESDQPRVPRETDG